MFRKSKQLQAEDGQALPSFGTLVKEAQAHKAALTLEGKYPGNKYMVEDRFSKVPPDMAVGCVWFGCWKRRRVCVGCDGAGPHRHFVCKIMEDPKAI